MIRLLNVAVILCLVAAAISAYSIKYEATAQAEKVTKLQRAITGEENTIARLRADWAELVRPDRIQGLARRHLDLEPMKITQVVKATDLPAKVDKDLIEQKLKGLGIASAPETTGSVR